MADQQVEQILLQLTLDVDKTTDALAKIRIAISVARDALKDLQAKQSEFGKDTASYKNYQVEIEKTNAGIKSLSAQAAVYERALVKSAQAQDTASGSMEQMKAKLSELTALYNLKTQAEKTSDAATIQMGKDINTLSSELKKQEGALGNHTRNVGDYENAIKNALGSVTLFGVNLGQLQQNLQSLQSVIIASTAATEAAAAAKKAAAAQAVADAAAQQAAAAAEIEAAAAAKAAALSNEELAAAEALSNKAAIESAEANKAMAAAQVLTAEATGGVSVALKIFRLALISTGIGALIVALGVLIASLSQNQKVLDFVSNAAKAVGAAFHVLVDAAISIEKAVVDAFSHPLDSIKSFMSFIETNVINRFKAIPVILEAVGEGFNNLIHLNFDGLKQSLKDVASGFVQFTTGLDKGQQEKAAAAISNITSSMKAAAGAAFDLGAATNKLKDDENAYIVQKEANQKKIDDLRLAAKQTNDLSERKKDLQEALAIEEQQIDAETGFAKRRADISQQEFDLKKDHTRDEITANQQAQAEILRIEDEGDKAKRKLQTELNRDIGNDARALLQQQKEAAQEAQQIAHDEAQAAIDVIKDSRLKAQAEDDLAHADRIAKIKENGEARKLSQSAIDNQLSAEHDLYIAKQKETSEKYDEEILKQNEETDQKRLDADKKYQDQANALAIKYAATKSAQLAAELKQVTDNAQFELAALELAADREKEEKVNGVAKTAQEVAAIDAQYATKRIAVLRQNALTIAQITETHNEELLKEDLQAAKDQEAAAGKDFNAKLAAQIKEYGLEEQQELIANAKSLRTVEDKEIAEKAIHDKYNKLVLVAEQLTQDAKLKIISTALGDSASLFSQNTAAYKVLATAQAVINTYLGASQAIADYPFPYDAIAAAAVIAMGLENVAKINNVSFYKGGFSTEGGHTGSGSPTSESTALGNKPYTYHEEEYIVPHQVLAHPTGRQLVSSLERMRVGSTSPAFTGGLRGFAQGGVSPSYTFVAQNAGSAVSDQYATENALIKAARLIPPPIVTVQDINTAQTRVGVIESRANI